VKDQIIEAMQDAELKAWKALAGYKFLMFGYHAARWVNYRNLLGVPIPNPFRSLVDRAQHKITPSQTLPLRKEEKRIE